MLFDVPSNHLPVVVIHRCEREASDFTTIHALVYTRVSKKMLSKMKELMQAFMLSHFFLQIVTGSSPISVAFGVFDDRRILLRVQSFNSRHTTNQPKKSCFTIKPI